ncbi:hypothetical protein AB0E69_14740 [Kribbella sp. NPDC026611]|uniref:hypothetical protein n=1 Tax=Kribbella sp. NPDC026611 TaxID=3154911 RepID=UPI003400F523
MPSVPLSSENLAIVVKGHFKAAIFSPAWMWKQELIGPVEYEAAEVEIISADVAKFRCMWLDCFISPDTLQFSTTDDAEFERVRDAMVGVLRILDQTPIAALGINRSMTIQISSPDRWHSLGDKLIPKEPWEDVLKLPGMAELTLWGVRPDLYSGRIAVVIGPTPDQGVSIAYNDHYELDRVESQPTKREDMPDFRPNAVVEATQEKISIATEILLENFESSLTRANDLANHVFKMGEKE